MINNKAFASQVVQVIGPLSFEHSKITDVFTLFVDGGLNHNIKQKISSSRSVGDGDSLKFPDRQPLDTKYPKDKDFSDLHGALKELDGAQIGTVELLGFLGQRKDHELSNIFEVSRSAIEHTQRIYNFENKVSVLSKGIYTFTIHGSFSLFSLEKTMIKVLGACKYPFEGELRPFSSHGLSNIGSGMIKVEVLNSHLIVYLNNGCTFNNETS